MKLELTIPQNLGQIPYYQVFTTYFEMSQSLIRKVRIQGYLIVQNEYKKMIDLCQGGERCQLILPSNKEAPAHLGIQSLKVLYEDEHFIAIDKPQNMVTHPSLNHYGDSLLDQLGNYTFHPITRLDRDTFGIVLIGKNPYVHQVTSSHPMKKIYLGLCYHKPSQPQGSYLEPIARHSTSLIERVVDSSGQWAHTDYKLLSYHEDLDISMIQYQLKSGRTHQIRVHSAYHGHPLVADSLYSPKEVGSLDIERNLLGQALVAYELVFYHPIHREEIHLQASLPNAFTQIFPSHNE